MGKPPYVGVTGFMAQNEVGIALAAHSRYIKTPHKLMVGVLASSKTVRGEKNKWPGRFPLFNDIGDIFVNNPSALNLVHYSTDIPDTLASQLSFIADELTGTHLQGFQLNVKWPAIAEMRKFHDETERKYRIVLQVGGGAMKHCDDDPFTVASMVLQYGDLIDDVLIDPSGGLGKPFDTQKGLAYLRAIRDIGSKVNLGIAGGLGPRQMEHLEPIVREFPNVSFDAEGRLRDPKTDALSPLYVSGYLADSGALLKAKETA